MKQKRQNLFAIKGGLLWIEHWHILNSIESHIESKRISQVPTFSSENSYSTFKLNTENEMPTEA